MEKNRPVSSATLFQVTMKRAYGILLPINTSVTEIRNLYDSKRVSIQQCLSRMALQNCKRNPSLPLVVKTKKQGKTYWQITEAGFQSLEKDISLLPNSGLDINLVIDPRSL